MLERGLDCLVAGAFGPKRMTLLLTPHWSPSLAACLHLLQPGFIGQFLSGATEKGYRVLFFYKNSLKSFKNRFPVYLLKKH